MATKVHVIAVVFLISCILLPVVYLPQIKKFLASQNGGYSKWTPWTGCTKTCGGGRRARARNCTNPRQKGYGRSCVVLGRRFEFETCNDQPCPVDGKPGIWGQWGSCSKQCGLGEEIRERPCAVKEQHGGRPCAPQLLATTRLCKLKECPVDGKYSDWKAYSACSSTCGPGKKERTRECNNPAPAHGGRACEGPAKETTDCNEKPCPRPVDGKYSDWKPYGACSTTCGPGKKERTRECNNPAPAHGGKACEGPTKETTDCNEKACPKEEKKQENKEEKKQEKNKEKKQEEKKEAKKQEQKKAE